MRRRYYVIISVIPIGIVTLGLVYFDFIANRTAARKFVGTPPLLDTSGISPQNLNASQSTTQKVNLTLTSRCPTEIAIPVENLMVEGYRSAIYYSYDGGPIGWNASAQQAVFNYSFSINQLILKPYMSNSTILTIKLANNATLGSYSLDIYLGRIIFLSAPEQYYVSYSEDISLVMVVTPNEAS